MGLVGWTMSKGAQSRSSALLVKGIHTDICITPFEDRVMVIISQTGTMGTLVMAEQEGADTGPQAFGTRICFGNYEDEMAEVLARNLAETLERPLLLSISLKNREPCPETFQLVTNHVRELVGM